MSYEDYARWYYQYYYGGGNYYGGHAVQPHAVQPHAVQPPPPGVAPTPPPGVMPTTPSALPYNCNAYQMPQHPPPSDQVKSSPPQPTRSQAIIKVNSKRSGLGAQPTASKKAKKAPVISVSCEVCDITVSSQQVYDEHIKGKAHRKKLGKMAKASSPTDQIPRSVSTAKKPQMPKKTKKKSNNQGSLVEQVVYQCELCTLSVNSQQQLDLHLTGTKHKKTLNRLSKSKDPEIQKKLETAIRQADTIKQHLPQTTKVAELLEEQIDDTTAASNLPPGYVIIPAAQSGTGKDTYHCSTCQHSSTDLFSLNAHVMSDEHREKSAKQEKPLETVAKQQQPAVARSQTNFNLIEQQTSNANDWKSNKVVGSKRIVPLSASFVSGPVMK